MADIDFSKTLFEPCNIMGLDLPNRFIRSATVESMASPEDGTPSQKLKALYKALALGGVGLISTGGCMCDRGWVPDPRGSLAMDSDATLPAWEETAEEVHRGGALISLQMAPFFYMGGNIVGPSAYREGVKAVTTDQIEQIVSTYGETAARAKKAGLDAVQVHAGHGYPLCQFISPHYNKRTDRYGGSPLNRARILVEIRKAAADRAGLDFPVWIKMNAVDGVPDGLTSETAAEYAPILAEAGYAAIEVTGGIPGGTCSARGPGKKEEWFEGYFLEAAAEIKSKTTIPVVAVGGIRTLEMAESILSTHTADLIAMSRPFIREPDLINRWRSGDTAPSHCDNCNGCMKTITGNKGVHCIQKKP